MIPHSDEAKMIHDIISAHIFSWLSLSEIAGIAVSSKDGYSLIQSLLSIGLITAAPVALHHLKVTHLLAEKVHTIKPSSVSTNDGDIFLRNLLKPAREVVCGLYDIKPRVMQKILQLCSHLQKVHIVHPTSAIIKRINSLIYLTHISLGQTGYSNIKCSDESILVLLRAVGNQLKELNLKKLNCLTVKSVEGISQYCQNIEKLSIVSCNGVRATSSSSSGKDLSAKAKADRDTIGHLMKGIGETIIDIDIRYSIEMNDKILQQIIDNFNPKKLVSFVASRTTSTQPEDTKSHVRSFAMNGCGCPEKPEEKNNEDNLINLTPHKWSIFVDHFRHFSTLLYIDNIGNEGVSDPIFLFKKGNLFL